MQGAHHDRRRRPPHDRGGLTFERPRGRGRPRSTGCSRDFIAHYAAHIADRSRPFPGLIERARPARRAGCILAVCTNKLECLSRLLLDALGPDARFAAICGQDTFGMQKPDPGDPAPHHRSRPAAAVARAMMVGDSGTDIETARAAGMPVVAVDFGYTETPVAELRPDRRDQPFRPASGGGSGTRADCD